MAKWIKVSLVLVAAMLAAWLLAREVKASGCVAQCSPGTVAERRVEAGGIITMVSWDSTPHGTHSVSWGVWRSDEAPESGQWITVTFGG